MSLLFTMQEIEKQAGDRYKLIVALPKWNEQLADFYRNAGFEVFKSDWIDTYEHTKLVSYKLWNPFHITRELIQLFRLNRAKSNTKKLIDQIKPDIIHLNSVVLLGSALAAKEKKIPLVWHVREPSTKGFLGVRRAFIKKYLHSIPDKVVFICNADKRSWGSPDKGTVIYNFVDFDKFDRDIQKPTNIFNIEISRGDLNILFLGAVGRVKGGLYLVKAVNRLLNKYPDKDIYLLFPGGIYETPNYFFYRLAKKFLPLIGQGTYSQKIEEEISNSPRPRSFVKFPFVKNVPPLFAASDVLVFPSIRPHFARPIIEAGAMGTPVIGSRLPGVEELIENGETGFFVQPESVDDLTEKLEFFLLNKDAVKEMGRNGYKRAVKKFRAKYNVTALIEIYNSLTECSSPPCT